MYTGSWLSSSPPCLCRQLLLMFFIILSNIKGWPNFSQVSSLVEQTIAKAAGDWHFNLKRGEGIDCPYPCNPTCYDMFLGELNGDSVILVSLHLLRKMFSIWPSVNENARFFYWLRWGKGAGLLGYEKNHDRNKLSLSCLKESRKTQRWHLMRFLHAKFQNTLKTNNNNNNNKSFITCPLYLIWSCEEPFPPPKAWFKS